MLHLRIVKNLGTWVLRNIGRVVDKVKKEVPKERGKSGT